ncbi:hypothetical protein BU25DRAFT_304158, partial [Macroventuria anomochaeta]
DETVQCGLLYCSLKHPPKYIAISYTWGDVSDKRNILMLTKKYSLSLGKEEYICTAVSVTATLYDALNALRSDQEDVLVWIDGLSINQADTDKRTRQVRLMTEIYRNASKVAIWLGPEADNSDIALHLLQ